MEGAGGKKGRRFGFWEKVLCERGKEAMSKGKERRRQRHASVISLLATTFSTLLDASLLIYLYAL